MSGVFRPSCRLRLQLRLDEGANVGPLEGKLALSDPRGGAIPEPLASTTAGLKDQLSKTNKNLRGLRSARNDMTPAEFAKLKARYTRQRDAIQQALAFQTPGAALPFGLTTDSPDDLVLIGSILPTSASVKRNDLRTPDEFEAEIDFADAPIDPRVVRACFVDLDIGTVSPEDYQLGITAGATRADGSLLSLVERGSPETIFTSSCKFVGYVDEWTVTHDDSGGSVVKLRGRDLTQTMIGRTLDRGESLDLSKPIEMAIQELVDRSPLTRGIKVVFGQPGATKQGPVYEDALPKTRKARKGKQAAWAKANHRMSLWDHVTDVCTQIGLVPTFLGLTLFLLEPSVFFSQRAKPRQMVYGRNLERLEFNRKVGGFKVPSVEVRCYDPTIGQTRWARAPQTKAGERTSGVYGTSDPPKQQRANEVTPAGAAENKIQLFTLRGITDAKRLERTAASLYQQIGRQEIEGSFETSDLTSFDSPDEGDLLSIISGDSVELLIGRPMAADTTQGRPSGTPTTTTVQTLQEMSVAARKAYLMSVGWKEQPATRLALANELTANNTVFRVRDLHIEWSAESGCKISADMTNFIVVREDQTEAQAEHSPTDRAQQLVGDRSDQAAEQVRAGSATQTGTNLERSQGKIDNQTFQPAQGAATQQQRGNVRRFKGK